MANRMTFTRRLVFGGLACGLIVLLLGLFTGQTEYLPYATDNPKGDGTKAMFLLLDQAGFRTSRLLAVTPQEGGLMVMLEPDGNLREQDWRQVLGWVERGNTLLLASDKSNGLYQHFKFELSRAPDPATSQRLSSGHRLLENVGELTLPGPARLKQHQDMAFAQGDERGVYLAEVRQGKGRIVLLTLPALFTNKELDQKDNMVLLLNIVRLYGREDVWINEAVHGYSWEEATREVFAWPLGLAAGQLALGLLLLYWFWGKRFGRPVPLPAGKGPESGDYVNSMANIYRQGRARRLVLESVYQGFRQDLARYLGVREDTADTELVKRYSGRSRIDSKTLGDLLGRCEELLARPGFGEPALLGVARDIEIWLQSNLTAYRRVYHD